MGKVETFKQQPPPPPQQQQLTMPLMANCVTTPVSLLFLRKLFQLYRKYLILNKRIKYDGEKSINEKTDDDVKWPIKQINKKERKKRLNARMRCLVCPKSPLMVFSELFNDVPIYLQEHSLHNVMSYTATLEIYGRMYSGNHISKTQAKQKACENVLRIRLAIKISERSEKKEKSPMHVEMEGLCYPLLTSLYWYSDGFYYYSSSTLNWWYWGGFYSLPLNWYC